MYTAAVGLVPDVVDDLLAVRPGNRITCYNIV